MSAIEWKGPALSDQAHIRQRLLDDHAGRAGGDDEDEVEIAVADLADRPIGRIAFKSSRHAGILRTRSRRLASVSGA
jgi:hypothetical protein